MKALDYAEHREAEANIRVTNQKVCSSHLLPEPQETLHPGPSGGAACLTCRDTSACIKVTIYLQQYKQKKKNSRLAPSDPPSQAPPALAQRCYKHTRPRQTPPRLQGKTNVSLGTVCHLHALHSTTGMQVAKIIYKADRK